MNHAILCTKLNCAFLKSNRKYGADFFELHLGQHASVFAGGFLLRGQIGEMTKKAFRDLFRSEFVVKY